MGLAYPIVPFVRRAKLGMAFVPHGVAYVFFRISHQVFANDMLTVADVRCVGIGFVFNKRSGFTYKTLYSGLSSATTDLCLSFLFVIHAAMLLVSQIYP